MNNYIIELKEKAIAIDEAIKREDSSITSIEFTIANGTIPLAEVLIEHCLTHIELIYVNLDYDDDNISFDKIEDATMLDVVTKMEAHHYMLGEFIGHEIKFFPKGVTSLL